MRINRQPTTRAAFPCTQTSSKEIEQPANTKKASLHLQITMLCIDAHMVQVGAWGKLGGLKEDTGGHARGQATSGVHLDNYYCRCPPSLCLAWIPKKGSKTSIGGLQGALGSWGNYHWGGDGPRMDSPLECMGKDDQPTAGSLTPK